MSRDGGKKNRSTRTKLKALNNPENEKGEGRGPSTPEELEDAIFKAAQQSASADQARDGRDTTDQSQADLKDKEHFLRLPSDTKSLDEKVAGVWKNKMMGGRAMDPEQYQSGQHQSAASSANKAAIELNERNRINAQHEAMIGLVDQMFDSFQNLAYDFNQMAGGSDLELTWIRPSIARENVGSWHSGAHYVSVFSGRISTRYWTLVVRGTFEAVSSYIIPADKLLSFTSAPSSYLCYLEVIPQQTLEGVRWYWQEVALSQEEMAALNRALLDNLVQIAQEDSPPLRSLDVPQAIGIARDAASNNAPVVSQGPGSSMLGAELDYSAKLRASMPNDNFASNTQSSAPALGGQLHSQTGQKWNPVNTGRSAPSQAPAPSNNDGEWKMMGSSSKGGASLPPPPRPQSQSPAPASSNQPEAPWNLVDHKTDDWSNNQIDQMASKIPGNINDLMGGPAPINAAPLPDKPNEPARPYFNVQALFGSGMPAPENKAPASAPPPHEPSYMPAPAPRPLAERSNANSGGAAPASGASPVTGPAPGTAPYVPPSPDLPVVPQTFRTGQGPLPDTPDSCMSALELLITRFEKELEIVTAKGSEAFSRRDLKGAEHMIKLAELISQQNEALQKFKEEYGKDLT
ncbi:MAG: hypothetical protein K2X70_02710 [Candidatus Obscuribacterales bacterium]|nr:hypothetical protein [Candidatus Obscuribacterales bacterium]